MDVFRKKLYVVTCPTDDLKKSLIDSKIFSKDKVINLYDPMNKHKRIYKKKGAKITINL